jgi:predicted nuclease of predicted toxin-antitoxin system
MKILLDACVCGTVRDALMQAGHDLVWAGEWPDDPGDAEILARAHRERRLVITLDKDFGELAIVRRQPHAGILRMVDLSVTRQAEACLEALLAYGDEMTAGAIITVEPGRVRIRPPD